MRCSRRRVCRLRCVPKGDYQEQSPCLRHSRSDSVLRPWEGRPTEHPSGRRSPTSVHIAAPGWKDLCMRSPQTLSEADRRTVAAWPADCAEHVLEILRRRLQGIAALVI